MAKVLVIEDNADITKVLEKRLVDCGFEALISNDASEGLTLAHDKKPDLIILDLKLPEGGGLSVLRSLKVSTNTRDIPVVILTGVRSPEIKASALKEGAAAYVEKPYDPHQLMETIKTVLAKKKVA